MSGTQGGSMPTPKIRQWLFIGLGCLTGVAMLTTIIILASKVGSNDETIVKLEKELKNITAQNNNLKKDFKKLETKFTTEISNQTANMEKMSQKLDKFKPAELQANFTKTLESIQTLIRVQNLTKIQDQFNKTTKSMDDLLKKLDGLSDYKLS